jgi:hypothetical protein
MPTPSAMVLVPFSLSMQKRMKSISRLLACVVIPKAKDKQNCSFCVCFLAFRAYHRQLNCSYPRRGWLVAQDVLVRDGGVVPAHVIQDVVIQRVVFGCTLGFHPERRSPWLVCWLNNFGVWFGCSSLDWLYAWNKVQAPMYHFGEVTTNLWMTANTWSNTLVQSVHMIK